MAQLEVTSPTTVKINGFPVNVEVMLSEFERQSWPIINHSPWQNIKKLAVLVSETYENRGAPENCYQIVLLLARTRSVNRLPIEAWSGFGFYVYTSPAWIAGQKIERWQHVIPEREAQILSALYQPQPI